MCHFIVMFPFSYIQTKSVDVFTRWLMLLFGWHLGIAAVVYFFAKKTFSKILWSRALSWKLWSDLCSKRHERERHIDTHTHHRHTSRQKRRRREKVTKVGCTLFSRIHTHERTNIHVRSKKEYKTQTQKERTTLTDHKHTLVKKDAQTDTDLGEKKKETNKKWKDKYTSLHLNLLLPKRQQLSAVFCGRLSTTGKKVVPISYLGLSKTQQLLDHK